MPRIYSIKGHYYAGKWRKPGESYNASPTDALIMRALKNAADEPASAVVAPAPVVPPVAAVKPPVASETPPVVDPDAKPDDEGGQPHDETPPADEGKPGADDGAELAALKDEYKSKFGRLPHWKLSAANIRIAIDAE